MSIALLPGGLKLDGEIRQDFEFAPITGKLEREIIESAVGVNSLAHQVTKILVSALISLAGQPSNERLVRMLSSGDREFLILRLHCLIEPEAQWVTHSCNECEELVQFQLHNNELPIKNAGKGYPQTSVVLSHCTAKIRVPTGADEEALAENCKDHDAALTLILKRLITLEENNKEVELIEKLTSADLSLVDQILDSMSPQTSQSVNIICPYCSNEQHFSIDNYEWIVKESRCLEDQIHTLAFYYHWSEQDILLLSKNRRSHYVALIERGLSKTQGHVMHSNVLGAQ